MPTGTNTYAFSGGVNAVPGFGDRWKIGFGGTWAAGDFWSVQISSGQGDLTFGVGNLGGLTPTICFTYRDRVYVGMQSQVNFSDNGDPTGWEVQNPGAGFLLYLSQFGGQDAVTSLSQIQGRLAILARRSVQIWIVDADPSQFSLAQTLDNIGTQAPLSVQNIGDLDVIFLDDTGFRALRAREVTLNAYSDDLGTPVDELVRADLQEVPGSSAVGIVEPTTKNYWCYLNGKIYVFSKHVSSKISAWSTYLPTFIYLGVQYPFTPFKFVVFNGQVYCRTYSQELLLYGGTDNATYDGSVVTVETPYLDDKTPATLKFGQGIDFALAGAWTISAGTDPQSGTLVAVLGIGDGSNPAENKDSSYDLGRIAFEQQGTHFKIRAVSSAASNAIAIISSLIYHYNRGSQDTK